MTAELEASLAKLYETDYLLWVEANLERLEAQDYSNIDWKNLIEEIKDMGISERSSLESHLIVVLTHLLKWQFQPAFRSGSWKGSISEHRRRIRKALKRSPSLKPYLKEIFDECYEDAVEQAIAETDLSLETFPNQCPYSQEEVLDANFLPK